LSNFLTYNETRTGSIIFDPVLALFDPINLTWSTFALIYFGLLAGIYHFVQNPPVLVRAILTYSFLALIRICMMYSIPLDPPPEMISLTDPFVELFGTGSTLDRDLFFSGHTSTMFMLFLLAYKPVYKKVYLAGVVLVGASVILQHAHYTIDVLVAPFVAYASYRIAGFITTKVVKT
jgi:membrane-associated phospholipid phosphatase